jgi:hypothetical protein
LARSLGVLAPSLLPLVWDDYTLGPDATYGTAKGAGWSDFWVSFSIILFQSFIPNTPDFAIA